MNLVIIFTAYAAMCATLLGMKILGLSSLSLTSTLIPIAAPIIILIVLAGIFSLYDYISGKVGRA